MERELSKLMGEFFGRNIQNRKAKTSGNESVITVQEKNKTLKYHIDNMSIEEIKQVLSIPKNEGAINLGRQAARMWLTLVAFSYEQHKGGHKIGGEFKISDIIKVWEVSDGSKTRRAIKDLISSLYSSSFTLVQHIGKNEKVTMIARPVPTITKHDKEGEETVYRFELNEATLGRSKDWIRLGTVPKSWKDEGFLSLPKADLSEKNQNVYYLNFRERLRLVGGDKKMPIITTTVKADTLLETWFKFDQDKLTRRTFCRKTIISCLETALRKKELLTFNYNLPENKSWKTTWFIEVTKSNRKI